jgi:hypothetical protein
MDVDAVRLEQPEQDVADRIGADRSVGTHVCAQATQDDRRAPGGAGRGDLDGLDKLTVGSFGNGCDPNDVSVEDVHPYNGDVDSSHNVLASLSRNFSEPNVC